MLCQRCAHPSRFPASGCFWRQQAAFPTLPFRRSPGGLHVLSSSFGTDAAWLSWCSFSIDCVGLNVSHSFFDGTRAGRITVTELLTRSTSTAQGAVRTGSNSNCWHGPIAELPEKLTMYSSNRSCNLNFTKSRSLSDSSAGVA